MQTNLKCMSTFLIVIIFILSSPLTLKAQDESSSIKVIGKGIALTKRKALKEALMDAVEKTVGMMVDSKTLMENDEIIEDRILTYSDGYIESYNIIKEEKTSDGLYKVKINADVKKRQLIEKLESNNISIKKADTGSLFAQLVTKKEANKNSSEILKSTLDKLNLPDSLFIATVKNSRPEIVEEKEDGAKVNWVIEIKFDQEKYYRSVLPSLKKTLDDIALKKSSTYLISQAKRNDDDFSFPVFNLSWPLGENNPKFPKTEKSEIFIAVNIAKNLKGDNLRWNWYIFDKKNFLPIVKKLRIVPNLRVALLDSQDNIINENEIHLADYENFKFDGNVFGEIRPRQKNGKNYPLIVLPIMMNKFEKHFERYVISPFITYSQRHYTYADKLPFNYTIDLSLEEMQQISKIKCYFVERSIE